MSMMLSRAYVKCQAIMFCSLNFILFLHRLHLRTERITLKHIWLMNCCIYVHFYCIYILCTYVCQSVCRWCIDCRCCSLQCLARSITNVWCQHISLSWVLAIFVISATW